MEQGGDKDSFRTVLRSAGFRATPGRLAILHALRSAKEPLSIRDIKKRLTLRVDQVTVYRILSAFVRAGVIRRVDLQHRHAHYELADRAEHHHLICTSCGVIEDYPGCNFEEIARDALKKSMKFAAVTQHSLELFGLCRACAKGMEHGAKGKA
jgi:Fur family ferric uptake transcriptional regulator